MSSYSLESSYRHYLTQGLMLTPAFTIVPLGNFIGKSTSQGIDAC
jgi:hypothetical protein